MRITKDLLSGLIFLAFGVATIVLMKDYAMGSLLRMGPAYYPTLVGGLTAVVGLTLIAKAFLRRDEPLPRFGFKPFFYVLIGVLVFALGLQRVGLVITTLLLVVICRMAAPRPMSWTRTAVLSAFLILLAVLIFWYFLKLPLRLWP